MSHGMFSNWDDAFAYDDDMDQAYGEYDGGYYGRSYRSRPHVKCRHCGSTNVYWAKVDDLFVLYDLSSRKHVCEKTPEITVRNVSAFDDLNFDSDN